MHALEEIFAQYLDETKARRNDVSQQAAEWQCEAILDRLKGMGLHDASDIERGVFSELQDVLQGDGLSEHSIATYLSRFRSVMNWAIDVDYIEQSDVGPMDFAKPQKGRKRWLTKQEISDLFDTLGQHWLRLPAALGVYGGLRRSEMCRVKLYHILEGGDELEIPESKNKEPRRIKLHPTLCDMISREWLNEGVVSSHVWLVQSPNKDHVTPDYLTQAWRKKVQNEIGWEGVTPHVLRHTCGAHLAQSGEWTLWQIARFLGHKHTTTTELYAHLIPGQKRPEW